MKIIWVGRACDCNLKYQIYSICIWGLGRKLTLCGSTRHWLPAQNCWLLNYSTGLSDIIQLLVLMITMMMMILILFSEAELAKVGDYNWNSFFQYRYGMMKCSNREKRCYPPKISCMMSWVRPVMDNLQLWDHWHQQLMSMMKQFCNLPNLVSPTGMGES